MADAPVVHNMREILILIDNGESPDTDSCVVGCAGDKDSVQGEHLLSDPPDDTCQPPSRLHSVPLLLFHKDTCIRTLTTVYECTNVVSSAIAHPSKHKLNGVLPGLSLKTSSLIAFACPLKRTRAVVPEKGILRDFLARAWRESLRTLTKEMLFERGASEVVGCDHLPLIAWKVT